MAETLNKRLAAKLDRESRENARRYWERKAKAKHDTPHRPCNMGVGCDESGFCYALAMGEPERCGREAEPAKDPRP